MALSESTLSTELQNMVPAATEAIGIDNFADAFETYFSAATVDGAAVETNSLDSATVALKAAMVGIGSAGMEKIEDGITAFWVEVETEAPNIWTLDPVAVSATQPPDLSDLTADLETVGAANVTGELGLVDAAAAIAGAIHGLMLGGIATDDDSDEFDIL
ncbi:MAG: hypothetical protein GY847_28820 [Proteobacteria bacterium]|nr:hypothetical protein [Pseudomonadota bacterium]